jgi:protein-S-isoprenylcysteine O-methyltransferase Ste14
MAEIGSSVSVLTLFAIAFFAGLAIQPIVPIAIGASGTLLIVILAVSGMLLIAGAVLAVLAERIFRQENLTANSKEACSELVTWGPYRFSRNPLYLGQFLGTLGIAGLFTNVWQVILLLSVLFYVNFVVVPAEERQLEENFGNAYRQYRAKVRRWI